MEQAGRELIIVAEEKASQARTFARCPSKTRVLVVDTAVVAT